MSDWELVNRGGLHSNFIRGVGLWLLTALLTSFGAAIMSSTTGDIASALGTVVASVIGGGFVMTAALVAWKSVQMQIGAQAAAEERKQEATKQLLKTALTAELLAYSSHIIEATSVWNQRAQNVARPLTEFPTLMRPRVYDAVLPHLGLLDGWAATAVISFYGYLLDLNDLSSEAMQGRLTLQETSERMAKRFQSMAKYLADSLDGLNTDRQFPITVPDVTALHLPDGQRINLALRPRSVQHLLYALAGDDLVYRHRLQNRPGGSRVQR
jgi:hypothetical protein